MRKLYGSEFSPIRTHFHLKETYSLNLVIVVYVEKKSVIACIPSGNFSLALSLGFYQEEIAVPNTVMWQLFVLSGDSLRLTQQEE